MKKLLTLVFAFIAFATISNAQIGIKAGLNLATQSISTEGVTVEPGNKIAFHVGVTYTSMINENISFRPGVLFSGKGYSLEFLDDDITANFGYIEIPLDFVYKTGALDISAGPYLGLLMSATAEGEDVKDQAESLDYGLNLGLSYNINANIGVGLNYGLGLANIAKTEDGDDSTVKNKVIGISLMYSL